MGIHYNRLMHPDQQKAQPYDADIKEFDRQLIDKVHKHLKESRMSQEELAGKIGISGPALSAWRRGLYKGNVTNVEDKIQYYFDHLATKTKRNERLQPYLPTVDYVPTSISEEIVAAIKYCQLEKGITIIDGDAGIGKTMAAKKFVQDNKHVAIYLEASPVYGHLGSFLKLLAKALSIPDNYPRYEQTRLIRQRMIGSEIVLIIDEAQHLQYRTLEEIRTMSDPGKISDDKGIGIVLIGNREVYDRMLGRQEARFAQLFSRITWRQGYSTLNVERNDVEMLFPGLKQKNMEKELEFLHGVCTSKWGIRGADKVYTNAAHNEDVSFEGLVNVARAMGIGFM
ncbi:AAA family ATPase [Ruminococcaceae bacterium OttesenSCG-928-D13]|nr:AAA family ATPase [Ruminococcaceae bacterium OttesenSCG-928-D13]